MRIFSPSRLSKSLLGLWMLLGSGAALWAQTPTHFKPVRTQGIFRVARINDAEVLYGATSITLAEGDEIGMFDGSLCVGATRVGSTPFPLSVSGILRYIAGEDTLPGADPTHTMTFRIWDASEQSELIASIESVSGGTFADDYTEISKLESSVAKVTLVTDPDLSFTYYVDRGHAVDTLSTGDVNVFYVTQDTTLKLWFNPHLLQGANNDSRYTFTQFDAAATTLPVSGDTIDYQVQASDVDLTIEAEFRLQHLLAMDYGPVGTEAMTGPGWYDEGSTATVSLAQDPYVDPLNDGRRWTFVQWGGEQSGTASTFTQLMDAPHSVTSQWQKQFRLTTTESPDEGGTVTPTPPENWYNDGTEVSVSATADSTGSQNDWRFTGWSGDLTGKVTPQTVVMDTNHTAIAAFEPVILVTVESNPPGRTFYVDGTAYTTATIFHWLQGQTHTLSVNDSVQDPGQGTRYLYTSWSDGGARGHDYTVPASHTTLTANFTTQHLVTLNTTQSSATGGGWHDAGTDVTFTIDAQTVDAGPGTRYAFTGWTGNAYTGPNGFYTVTALDGPVTETSGWVLQYELTVSTAPVPSTSVVGQGWHDTGATAVLTAVPYVDPANSGRRHRFAYYSGDASGTEATLNVLMNGPKAVTVHWQKQFFLTRLSNPTAGGNIGLVPDNDWVDAGGTVQAMAVANTADDWRWISWGGDLAGQTTQTVTVVMDTNKTAIANFEGEILITLGTSPDGLGYVVDGAPYSGTQTFHWLQGEQHTIAVNEPLQYEGTSIKHNFVSWSDGGAQSHVYTVPYTNQTVTANFDTEYLVTLDPVHGTATGGGWYAAGATNVTFSIDATTIDEGGGQRWLFTGWSGYGNDATSQTIAVLNGPVTQTATWQTQFFLTTGVSPEGGGTISPAAPGDWFNEGQNVSVQATPLSGHQWRYWSGDLASVTTNPANLIIDAPKSVVAHFNSEVTYEVSALPEGRSFTVDGVSYTSPQTLTWVVGDDHALSVEAYQEDGSPTRYVFESWSQGGDRVQTFTVPETGGTLTAHYTTQHKLTLTPVHQSATGGGYYDAGANATFSMDDETLVQGDTTRYVFTGWTGSGGDEAYTGTDASHAVVMNHPITEEATWQKQYYVDLVTARGTTTGGGWHDVGAEVQIAMGSQTVGAGTGVRYDFRGWTGAGDAAYTGPDLTANITVNEPITETADWTLQYLLSTVESPDAGGDITPAPPGAWYDAGEQVEVSATVNEGDEWHGFTLSDDPGNTQMDNPINVDMDGPKTVTANFEDFILVTVNSTHPGVQFRVGTTDYTTPHTFTYTAGNTYTFSVVAQQTLGDTIQYSDVQWSDGSALQHAYTIPTQDVIRTLESTAKFRLQILSDVGAPTGDGFYAENAVAAFAVDSVLTDATGRSRDLFNGWTGDHEGSARSGSIVIDQPKTITANWRRQHLLIVSAPASADPQGGGWYDEGGQATFSVTSPYDDGTGKRKVLAYWTGTGEGAHSTGDDPVQSEATVVMNYPIIEETAWKQEYQLNVAVLPEGGGTVTLDPEGGWYASGTFVTLAAEANPGYKWSGWTGDLISGAPSSGIMMTAPRTVQARFDDVLTVNLETSPNGLHYWVDGTEYETTQAFGWVEGESHNLSAPSPQFKGTDQSRRYVFDRWSDGGEQNHAYVVPASNITVMAYYKPQFLLNIQSAHGTPFGQGWVDSTASVDFGITESTVANGSKEKYVFAGWTGTGVGSYTGTALSESVTLNNGITQQAHWDTLYALSYSVAPEGKGTITATTHETWIKRRQVVQLTAELVDPTTTPYRFTGWTGDTTSTDDVLVLPMKKPYAVVANFELVTHSVTRTVQFVDPNGVVHTGTGGTITASPNLGDYPHRSKVTFTATAAEGMKFSGWLGDLEGTNPVQSPNILDDMTITASFVYADNVPPYIATVYPLNNSEDVPVNTNLQVTVKDAIYGVDRSTLDVTVAGVAVVNDGVAVNHSVSIRQVSQGFEVIYSPTTSFAASSTINVAVSCRDRANPANAFAGATRFNTGIASLTSPVEDPLPPTGGGVSLPQGVMLTIPEGAMPDTTLILAGQVLNPPEIPASFGKNHLGQVYYFGPDGMTFLSPVTVRLPFPVADLAALGIKTASVIKVYTYRTDTREWTEVTPVTVDLVNGTVTFDTGHFSYFRIVAVTPDVEPGQIINYPNPFNPKVSTTTLKYMLDEAADVCMQIFDVSSRLVTTLIESGTAREANVEYTLDWDGRNDQGDIVANNVYFCVLTRGSGKKAMIRKIVVLR